MNHKICCFTGHRDIPLLQRLTLKKKLKETIRQLIRDGVTEFRCGGALGFDTMAAQVVCAEKRKNPAIRLILMLPCRDQTKYWNQADIQIYESVFNQADEIVYTSEHYSRGCMHIRNRRLVEGSDVCVAFCERETGGAAFTVRYAQTQGLAVLHLGRE